ncbi:MAG TPA: type IV secretion protein IcmE, partial [Coxiellaceae bacterium]|nr:type IV secretion protein IcmE [Coxiellaceae bacterium]
AGFTAADIKAAGFSAKDLKDAGFTAAELKAAGFSADELKKSGFSAADMSAAGFTPNELMAAGYTSSDLVKAGVVVAGLGDVNLCSADSLKKARDSGSSLTALKSRGCSVAALKNAGFTAAELKAAGFTAKDLKNAGFAASDLYAAGFPAADLKSAGFSDKEVAAAKLLDSAGDSTASDFSDVQNILGRLSQEQLANMSDQEIANFLKQQQTMMLMQANQLFSAWTPVPSQQYVVGETPKPDGAQAEKAAPTAKEQAEEVLKNSDVYKAGTIIFAVLDTEVNTDENSPVMATIVQQGQLKGSKVIGNFTRVSEKVLLQFSVLSVPKLSNSIAINAVAVDPNTAKTAMASQVDNHYMLRYGTLFATSFVSGLGQAFQTAGGTSTSTTTGTLTTMPALNPMQKTLVAVGNVGQQFGSALSSKVNTPPTVKVKAGSSIGLLLMADLPVPKNQQQGNLK